MRRIPKDMIRSFRAATMMLLDQGMLVVEVQEQLVKACQDWWTERETEIEAQPQEERQRHG